MPILKNLVNLVNIVDKETGLSEDIDKPYLLLLVPIGAEPDPSTGEFTSGEFNVIRGRRDTFNYLKEMTVDFYDLSKSFVLSGNISFGKEVSIYTFMRLCVEKYKYETKDYLIELDERIISNNENISKEYLNMLYINELGAKTQ